MGEPLKVLISAYACGPNWGSEIGMGWNWVINMSEHCKLVVITEIDFKKDIEERLPELSLTYVPEFHYVDIGDKARKLFWKQGSFLFYYYYRSWQRKAYELALNLHSENKFDLIHQLNMIGYREPGYLWRMKDTPFIWGPVGGHNQVPFRFIGSMSLKNALFYLIKSAINTIQCLTLSRPKLAAKRSSVVLAATKESSEAIRRTTSTEVYVLNETGCELPKKEFVPFKKDHSVLNLIWVGRIQGLKALPLALKVLAKLSEQIPVHLTIVGDGPDEKKNRKLAEKLNIDKMITWAGRISNPEVIRLVQNSHALLFTSLKEGTPHVVMEALQNGIPVVCHDACGHGAVVNESCGIKVEQKNQSHSITGFTDALISLYRNPEYLEILSQGALEKAKTLSWSAKAEEMLSYYHKVCVYDTTT